MRRPPTVKYALELDEADEWREKFSMKFPDVVHSIVCFFARAPWIQLIHWIVQIMTVDRSNFHSGFFRRIQNNQNRYAAICEQQPKF